MERIKYRITLDVHKNGIQRTLQGFETADNMSRCIAVNLVASGDTFEIPLDHVVAMMYVTTPGASEPSINECTIEDNTVIYDVLPIVEEGITEMQLKLIETRMDGARSVLVSPRFAVEVIESGADDENAEQTTTFTALESAIAKAQGVYESRLERVEIDKDCTFRVFYADGTVYENDYLNEALYNGNALLSESWAKGNTGIRVGENENNSKHFAEMSKVSADDASRSADIGRQMADMAMLYSTYTSFNTNFETGELEYISANHNFDIDEETGELKIEGELFKPDEVVEKAVDDFLEEKTEEITELNNAFTQHKSAKNPHGTTASDVGALPIVDARGSNFDMDVILKSPMHNAYYIWDANTLGTPYKYGATSSQNGVIFTSTLSVSYGYQIAYMNGNPVPLTRGNKKEVVSEWSTQFLPLTGGTLSCDRLGVGNGKGMFYADANTTLMRHTYDDENYTDVRVYGNDNIASLIKVFYQRTGDTPKSYRIFGEHNKPSGSYTGNGSATARTINVGGISGVLFIRLGGSFALVTASGAIVKHGTNLVALSATEARFEDGTIYLATTNEVLNKSGNTMIYFTA